MDASLIRVLHVTTTGRIGGAERIIADLVRAAYEEQSYASVICVLRDPEGLRAELADISIPVISLDVRSIWSAPRGFAALVRLARDGRFDIVHAHLLHGSIFGLLAGLFARVPLRVMTRHFEMLVWLFGTRLERVMQLVSDRLAHAIFAVSRAAATTMVAREGVHPDRIIVSPNGVDADRILRLAGPHRAARTDTGAPCTVGTVGTLTVRKGHRFLIEALSRLAGDLVADLVIIGDGELRSALEETARLSGVDARVRFVGYQENVYPLVASFDIYVQPSIEEGFGIAVLEAMALGRPVVATRAGGLPEIVEDGVTGLLVRPGDAGQLADAIARLAADPPMRERIGSEARRMVTRRFGVRLCARRYTDAYRELLARHRPSARITRMPGP